MPQDGGLAGEQGRDGDRFEAKAPAKGAMAHRLLAKMAREPPKSRRELAALKNGQPAQPVEQIKETAVVGGDVVALDPLRAFWNIGQEMADLARLARVSNVNETQPVGEPCGRDLRSGHLFARLMAGRELRLRRAIIKALDLEACEWHRVPLVRDVDEPQAGGRSGRDARHVLVGDEQDTAPVQQKGQRQSRVRRTGEWGTPVER